MSFGQFLKWWRLPAPQLRSITGSEVKVYVTKATLFLYLKQPTTNYVI